MFLEKEDLINYIQEDNLDQILDGDDDKLTVPITDAIAFVKGHIDHRFNTATIFGATGSSRHSVIKVATIHVCLYYLHNLINPRNIPELRVKNYDDSVKTLTMIRKGELCQDLPLLTSDSTETGYVKYGDKPKNNNY